MEKQIVLKYAKCTPFIPFILHLADGQALRVRHPECLGVGEGALALRSEDDSRHVIALDQIVSIHYLQNLPRGGQ